MNRNRAQFIARNDLSLLSTLTGKLYTTLLGTRVDRSIEVSKDVIYRPKDIEDSYIVDNELMQLRYMMLYRVIGFDLVTGETIFDLSNSYIDFTKVRVG